MSWPLRSPRRGVIAIAIVGLVAALATAAVLVRSEGTSTAARPNIVVIMTDDQTVESMRVLPKVRELIGAQGATFADSIVSFSLCCPSRATYLTGQYAHNHGVRANMPPDGGFESFRDQETTFPVALQRAGYDTVHIGKYLNGYGSTPSLDAPPGWTEWHTELDPRSNRYFGFTLLEDGKVRKYRKKDYSTDVFTDLATSAISRRAASDRPFFLTVSYFAPHAGLALEDGMFPADPAPRHLGTLDGEQLPTTPAFDEADVSDKPQAVRDLPRIDGDVRATITTNYARYLESLLAVDEGVERIMRALRDAGELDDTVVIFTSDNGYFFGEHRITSGKVWFYEPAVRVPLLVRGPGIDAGTTLEPLVANIDLAPTILDLAGATPLRPMDGQSMVPLLRGAKAPKDRAVLLEAGRPDVASLGVRTGRYTYVELRTGERELYDRSTDPYELDNRIDDPALADVRADLAARLAALRDCAGATCR